MGSSHPGCQRHRGQRACTLTVRPQASRCAIHGGDQVVRCHRHNVLYCHVLVLVLVLVLGLVLGLGLVLVLATNTVVQLQLQGEPPL